ncbi:MAG: DNA repair protein RecN [Candidatus Azobacteroides sp.]|nr:DNA repair protein RecN [Candidatus Azobacteroides sp.]
MLKSLSIRNYALISALEIDFSTGFSVVTGETGAGKSIILGALSLILGQRADAKSVRQGEDKCCIEGCFDISSYSLEPLFQKKEWEYDAQNCILRREIWNSGKSRAFINDTPVGLNDLKELGSFLIDIHSQHQNLLLGDDRFQLQVLDTLAGNHKIRMEFKSAYRRFLSIRSQWQELCEKVKTLASEQDYLRFQLQQLEDARLKPQEQSALEEELSLLSHVEEIKNGLYVLEHLLSDEDKGIVISLKESLQLAQSLCKIYSPASEMRDRLQVAYFDLKDLLPDISGQQEKLEFDPERLQWINDRLDLLYSLQQKHKTDSVEGLIALQNQWSAQLQTIEGYDEKIMDLKKQMDAARELVLSLSDQLSATRKESAARLEKQLTEKVSVLGMPYIRFQCQMSKKEFPDSEGSDEICFLFSANKNGELKAVAQTASGGEISRLMLGIKALIAGASALPTIIFDEIDTGVSGEMADKMGDIMRQMSETMQVIAITHLPQIAAKGDSQWLVYKKENNQGTETHIRRLSEEERVKEIGQMLSGSELTSAALENAKQLLKRERK